MNHTQWLITGVTIAGFGGLVSLMLWGLVDADDKGPILKVLKVLWIGWAVVFGPFVILSWMKALIE